LGRFQWHDLDTGGILDDVEFGYIDGLAVADIDQSEIAQDPESALEVDRVIRYATVAPGLMGVPSACFFE
jgi:hypothetical protein